MKIGIAGLRGLSTLMGFRAIEGVTVTALCDLDQDLLESQMILSPNDNALNMIRDVI